MSSKNILGLDIGTASIGAAVVQIKENDGESTCSLLTTPVSRIIPMPDDEVSAYDTGTLASAAAARRLMRSMRRRTARFQLRRQRLFRVLNALGFLPQHFAGTIDFETRKGQFKPGTGEPKLAWNFADSKNPKFVFENEFNEMCKEFENKNAKTFPSGKNISRDWTLYFLRKKALSEKISPEALAWILLSFNAKRGYNAERGDDDIDDSKKERFVTAHVAEVEYENTDNNGNNWFSLIFEEKDSSGTALRKKIKNLANPEQMKGATFNLVVSEKTGRGTTVREVKEDDWKLKKTRTKSKSAKKPSASSFTIPFCRTRKRASFAKSPRSIGNFTATKRKEFCASRRNLSRS